MRRWRPVLWIAAALCSLPFLPLLVGGQVITPTNIISGNLLFSSDNTHTIGLTAANRPASLFLAAPSITSGSATGLTIVNTGEVRRQVFKATVGTAGCTAASVNCDVTIATLPAKTWVYGVLADLTTSFQCAATCTSGTLTGSLGTSAGGQQFLKNFDADNAAAVFGDVKTELAAATIDIDTGVLTIGAGAYLGSWSSTTTVVFRLASAAGNLGTGAATNLSQGSVTFYLAAEVWP